MTVRVAQLKLCVSSSALSNSSTPSLVIQNAKHSHDATRGHPRAQCGHHKYFSVFVPSLAFRFPLLFPRHSSTRNYPPGIQASQPHTISTGFASFQNDLGVDAPEAVVMPEELLPLAGTSPTDDPKL